MGTPSLGQRNRHTVVGIYGTLKGNETSSINGRTSHRTRRSAHTVRYCPTNTGLLPRLYPSSCFHMVNPLDTLGKDTTPCTSTMVLARNCERHKAHRTIAPSLSSLARRSPIDRTLTWPVVFRHAIIVDWANVAGLHYLQYAQNPDTEGSHGRRGPIVGSSRMEALHWLPMELGESFLGMGK